MPNALDKETVFLQNLKDAGCNTELTDECMKFYKNGKFDEVLRKLAAYRRAVLVETRKKQKQIDCIDYLTNKINKNEY